MAISRAQLAKELEPGLNALFGLEYDRYENEHAEISRVKGRYYLRDCGTEAGTFINITHPQVLQDGTLVEMGSFLVEAMHVDRANRVLCL